MSKRKPPPVASLPEKLLRKLAEPVPERLRKLVAPVPEKLRNWIDSLAERELRAIASQFPQPNDLTQPQPAKRKRRKGMQGHPRRALTDDQIEHGRKIFRDLLKSPKLKVRKETRAEQAKRVKKGLKLGNKVSNDTIVRHIIRPVLDGNKPAR